MNITKKSDGTVLTVLVEGRLDAKTSPDFFEDMKNSIDNVTELVLDFYNLDYISSAGLRSILSLLKIMKTKGDMKIINVSEKVMSVFEVTSFTDILDISQK